jgi:hypothetical protein
MNPPNAANVAIKNCSLLGCIMYKNVLEERPALTLRKFLSSGKVFLRKVGVYLLQYKRSHSRGQ